MSEDAYIKPSGKFPSTRDELVRRGYKFSNHAVCKFCGEDIEWWETPKSKKIPMNEMPVGTSEAEAHFGECKP